MSLNSGRTAQYKHNAQFLRHFCLHGDVNDAHRAGANRLPQQKQNNTNLHHQHLADLTRAKKVLRYLKGTRELNLYFAIPALKPNDLNKTLKHVTGYSDADWAGDPVTRKSTSCTVLR